MSRNTERMSFKTRSSVLVVAAFVSTAVAVGCTPIPPPPTATSTTTSTTPPTTTTSVPADVSYLSVMGTSSVPASKMVAWFEAKTAWYTGVDGASVPTDELAQMFLDEGRDEGVRGDIAFVQAMIETGWLRFSERMPMEYNNFSGIGAVDGGTGANRFVDARTGVRAQIQHLRAYADPAVTVDRLAHPLVDPRFNLVVPKGKATNWTDFGNGIWATDPGYAGKVKRLYDELLAFTA